MSEQIETKIENIVPGGMMLRKRVKDGKKYVKRMVYVERPQQSKDPQHNAKRAAKRDAALRIKEQRTQTQKEIKNQMEIFDMRFVVASMNKFAPKGWRFVTVGDENRIAMQSIDIMGPQSPRGAFVSDISFDLLFGLYADLFNPKEEHAKTNMYEQIKFFQYEKPNGVSQADHENYLKIIKKMDSWDLGMVWPFACKHAPTRPMLNKNAILVQGIMDAGHVPPHYLNERMHKIVNETVWWTFRRVMLDLTLERLQKLRKLYRSRLAAKAIIPGKKFGLATHPKLVGVPSQKQRELETRLDNLIKYVLPNAIAQTSEASISLHCQMAQLVDLQPSKFSPSHINESENGIKPSKKLKHIIQREIDDLCSGTTQRQNVEQIHNDICKTIAQINGAPMVVKQPAREMMPNVFYVNGDRDTVRKISDKTPFMQQVMWLTFGHVQKTK